MGRPPLKGTTMNVLLPEGVAQRIDALVGNRRRAKFIRDATITELERQEAAARTRLASSSARDDA